MSGSSPSAGGQAPESGQPQAGTPAPGAPTPVPGAPPTPAPQAGASQPTQPRYTFNSQEEIEAFADRLIDQRRRANRQAQQAEGELSELKQQVQYLVVQQQMDRQRAIAANVQLQAKNLGFRNPAFVYGAIASQLQYDQASGQPSNAATLLEALKASDPYLLETPSPQPGTPPPPAQPGQPQTQPGAPGPQPAPQPQGQPPAPAAPTGVMNAPQSAAIPPGGGLTWEVITANIHNAAWVAANEAQLETFMANPVNHQNRPRR